ncbi:SIMPL domain-containing protein [Sphaerisporangium corydalis]|uniref:SIMPL domain-containing protein n=1 Tax=Sphaerisporangium corydalis TaxID=1441875 RepID=A0ABV9EN85_9ACTN|nr:SIMPL domain-containing protein [Sphaerisporangium corydalis]
MTKKSLVPAAIAIVLVAAQAGPALAASGPPPKASGHTAGPAWLTPGDTAELVVVGRGSVQTTPDVMRLNVGVETRRARAGEAFAAVKEAAAKLTDALVTAGVARWDLKTNDLSLVAEYDKYPKVVGYRASQGLEAQVRDLSKADAVVDAVAAVGDEARLNGISFEISREEALVKRARAVAYKDARAKAEQYAALVGRTLGRVTKLEEESDSSPSRLAAFGEKAGISPGHGSVTVAVRVVYEMV